MARYSIDGQILTALGDAVRSQTGETEYRDVTYTSKTYYFDANIYTMSNHLYILVCGATQMKVNKLAHTGDDYNSFNLVGCSCEIKEGASPYFSANTEECIFYDFTQDSVEIYSILSGWTYDFEITWYDADGNVMEVTMSEEAKKTMTPERMVTEISNLQAIEPSLLNLTGRLDYKFYNGNWDDFIEIYGDQITTKDVTGLNYMFGFCDVENIPFEINCKVDTLVDIKQLCNGASKLLEPPIINNVKVNDLQQAFKGCQSIRYFPEGYGEDWDWSYITAATSGYYGYKNGMFDDCYSLRQLPMELFKHNNPYLSYSYSPLKEFRNMYSLDEVVDMPFTIDTAFSGTSYSSPFYNSFTGLYRCKEFTFAPDIGVKKWAKQVLDFSKLGYGYSSTKFYNSGITADKEVNSSTTYAALKDDPDWFAVSADYSRYSMDAMIRTINSLPDCSEYAAANGTNTIKFDMTAGRGYNKNISSLPEDVAAVAAARGWTVSFV